MSSPALGRLDFFETALAFMAGYGIRSFLIAQSLNQIDKAYGPNNSILDNRYVRVAYATNDERTAKRISEMLGTATELRAAQHAGHRLAPGSASHGVASRDGSTVVDARRSHAASTRRGGGNDLRPSADQGAEAALLRGRELHPARTTAACARPDAMPMYRRPAPDD